jgi:4-hydroxy-4-methyl-2-oxoglutarate aldolase
MNEVINDIIEFCRQNRVSTTEVADALNKTGHLEGIKPVNPNHYKVGKVFPIFTNGGSNYPVHEQIKNAGEGDVVIIFTHGCKDLAIIGDLVSKYAIFYKQVSAIVVQGAVRDVSRLKRELYPIWSIDFSPIGCSNTPPIENFPRELKNELLAKYENSIAVCDDGGVVVIEQDKVNLDQLSKLKSIEIQEDIWAYCLNTLKWDTKKIVCDKAYLSEAGSFSANQIEKIKEIDLNFNL